MAGFVANAKVTVDASAARVWRALTDPDLIAQYMFGSRVETQWQVGGPIFWRGEFEGRPYEDKGRVLEVQPERTLRVSHFSPLSGQEDVAENYHQVTYELTPQSAERTVVEVNQDNAADEDEAARFSGQWQMMLDGLKQVAERSDERTDA
jgi:uncharacterized protein YndB with AHSA1/START domain